MLSCPNGHPGKSGQGYCAACGGTITHRCPNGHEAPLGIAFCGTCGSNMSDRAGSVGGAASAGPAWGPDGGGTAPGAPDPFSMADTLRRPPVAPAPEPPVVPLAGPAPRSSRRGIIALASVGLVVAVLAAVLTVTLSGGHGGHHVSSASPGGGRSGGISPAGATPAAATQGGTGTSTTTSTGGGPVIPSYSDGSTSSAGSSAAATIAGYLSQSAAVRPSVQQAINGVSSCSEDPGQGASTVQQAASTREQIAQELPSLDVSQLANGSELVSDLVQAMQDSANSDNDYASWMQDVASGSSCSDTADDSNFQSAQSSDQTVNQEKAQFAAVWNAEAAQYGQQTYDPGTF